MPIDVSLLETVTGPIDDADAALLGDALESIAGEKQTHAVDLYARLHARLADKRVAIGVDAKRMRDQADKLRRDADRIDGQLEEIEAALREHMTAAGVDRLATDRSEILLIENKKTRVEMVDPFDVEQIPEPFVRVKKEADKVAIDDALKKGEALPFARLEPLPSTVRVRFTA
jgi:hypothetical protein